jgi:hypothetical protein
MLLVSLISTNAGPNPATCGRKTNLVGAEIVMIVFDETGQDVGEDVFTVDTDGPSRRVWRAVLAVPSMIVVAQYSSRSQAPPPLT